MSIPADDIHPNAGHPSQPGTSILTQDIHPNRGHLPQPGTCGSTSEVSDRLGWSHHSPSLLLGATSTLSLATEGNQGQKPRCDAPGPRKGLFVQQLPVGIVPRAGTVTPRTRNTNDCVLLASLGLPLLANAQLAFAQSSQTFLRSPVVAGWPPQPNGAYGSPSRAGHGGPGRRFLLLLPSAPPQTLLSTFHLYQPNYPAATPPNSLRIKPPRPGAKS